MNHVINIGCGLVALAIGRAVLPDFLDNKGAWMWMTGWLACYFTGIVIGWIK